MNSVLFWNQSPENPTTVVQDLSKGERVCISRGGRYGLSRIDPRKRILEVGPLHSPMFYKHEADIYYADISSREMLLEQFKGESFVDDICPIDFIITKHEGRTSYTDSLKHVEKFDYFFSSHVLEHIPRLIEFLLDIPNIMKPDGIFWAVLPDHRYCFDHFRQPISFSELWYVYDNNLECPYWRMFEHSLDTIKQNDPAYYCHSKQIAQEHMVKSPARFAEALSVYRKKMKIKNFSAHLSTFTPESFLLIAFNMVRAGLFPYRFLSICPTPPGDLSFSIELQVCPLMREDKELIKKELGKIASMIDRVSTLA